MLLSTEAELQMHLVELGEHMDDPGELQPGGGGAENGADRRESGHLFGGDVFSHVCCLKEKLDNFVADAEPQSCC